MEEFLNGMTSHSWICMVKIIFFIFPTGNQLQIPSESNVAIGNPLEIGVPIGKSPINSAFSIAMFEYRRVREAFSGFRISEEWMARHFRQGLRCETQPKTDVMGQKMPWIWKL